MVPRSRCICRQERCEWQIVAVSEVDRLEIENCAHEDDAVEIHAVAILKMLRQSTRARCAVGFADQILR